MIQDSGNIYSVFFIQDRLSVLVRFASVTSATNVESNTTFTVLNEVRWW